MIIFGLCLAYLTLGEDRQKLLKTSRMHFLVIFIIQNPPLHTKKINKFGQENGRENELIFTKSK